MIADTRLAPTTFYREIDRNRRRSWLLVAVVILRERWREIETGLRGRLASLAGALRLRDVKEA